MKCSAAKNKDLKRTPEEKSGVEQLFMQVSNPAIASTKLLIVCLKIDAKDKSRIKPTPTDGSVLSSCSSSVSIRWVLSSTVMGRPTS